MDAMRRGFKTEEEDEEGSRGFLVNVNQVLGLWLEFGFGPQKVEEKKKKGSVCLMGLVFLSLGMAMAT